MVFGKCFSFSALDMFASCGCHVSSRQQNQLTADENLGLISRMFVHLFPWTIESFGIGFVVEPAVELLCI
jgi:hypothetical protein